MTKLVVLDRDGVINEDSPDFIRSVDQWTPITGAIEAITRLSNAGWTVAVATNQSGLARGYFDESALAAMHDKMITLVNDAGGRIAHIAYCPHGPDERCQCRKPLPGLLYQIRDALGIETLAGAWMVGDSLRDLQAGQAAGCRVALVRTGKGRITEGGLDQLNDTASILVADSLANFVDKLLNMDSAQRCFT
ncbi:D-glycero-beta-D-manno-heptose 1,7-bisphosphate 7-phosphatase [Phytohalomonas tamaricis]|uniref:D-glycero-beta-D-manno-heptose 1,7-bisphosphate 7-phosphatase n=1 Tax=Phytohalomonas tamaricis TaxID=2081032 RepID=UPI000D0AC7A4|nr:D-glycero-beta-D-manno-heptose 1,7-bisphosphate 7-phosphatase [Phytohalomonas tamaricis]